MSETPATPQPNPAQQQYPMPQKKPFYKKAWFIILAVIFALLVLGVALSGGEDTSSTSTNGQDGTSQNANSSEAKEAETKEVETDYPITIDGANIVQDTMGDQAIVVTYTWTNNSDKGVSFDVALDAKAYQNGVELETDVFVDETNAVDFRDVKPGTTSTVKVAYKLADTSEVEVEVKELFSLNDNIIASEKFAVQ